MKGGVERRAVALDSSIENVLIEAGVRAAEQLRSSCERGGHRLISEADDFGVCHFRLVQE